MSNSYSYGKRAWNIRLGSSNSFLGAYLVHLSSFEDGHKVLVLLVSSLLHLHVVGRALFDLSAEEGQLCQLLGYVVRGLHLLQAGNPGVKNSHCCGQALLSISIFCTVSLGHTKLVVCLGYRPGICRQSLDPLCEAECQILNSLLEVRILQAHLSQEGQRLAFLSHVTSLAIDNLCQVKHLPGLLQVTSLSISLLGISLHLIANLLSLHHLIIFSLLLSVVTSVSSGHNVVLLKVLLQGVSNLLLNL